MKKRLKLNLLVLLASGCKPCNCSMSDWSQMLHGNCIILAKCTYFVYTPIYSHYARFLFAPPTTHMPVQPPGNGFPKMSQSHSGQRCTHGAWVWSPAADCRWPRADVSVLSTPGLGTG